MAVPGRAGPEVAFPGKLELRTQTISLPERKRSSTSRFFSALRRSSKDSTRSSVDTQRSSIDIAPRLAPRKPSLLQKPVPPKTNDGYPGRYLVNKSRVTELSDDNTYVRDRVTGELKDPTDMLHSIAHEFDTPERNKLIRTDTDTPGQPAQQIIDRLPERIWKEATSYLTLADQAALLLSAKAWAQLLPQGIINDLNQPAEAHHRLRCDLLQRLNYSHPDHLLCYSCAKYHIRIQKGSEVLRPTNVFNPLYDCPYHSVADVVKRTPRHRTTFGRALPWPFLSLVLRQSRFGNDYGIPYEQLGRRYKDRDTVGKWFHQTRYAVIDNHFYLRIVSYCFAQPNLPPAGLRHLLYSREDFTPFFSVCAHWRDGVLMPVCKCALGHVPAPLAGGGPLRLAREVEKHFKGPENPIVRTCEFCNPIRRCPECPTEYLVEIRMQEDREEKDPTKLFKYAIVVTRWSDLGDGRSPWSGEWAAVNNENIETDPETGEVIGEAYDSFQRLGRRAVSGTFESFFNPEQIPPARLVSLNPDKIKRGEKGHTWY